MSGRIMSTGIDEIMDKKRQAIASSRLLTPEECAAFLQVEVNTLYVMRSQGRIPYRKVGHLLRFDYEEIVEWTKPKDR